MYSAARDGTFRRWSLRASPPVVRLPGDGSKLSAIGVSSDGRYLATGAWNGSVAVHDLVSGRKTSDRYHHAELIDATVSYDHRARLWDTGNLALVATLEGHTDRVGGVAWSPDGTRLATSGRDHTIRTWHVEGHPVQVLQGHRDWVNRVCYTVDGRYLLSSSDDGEYRLWDPAAATTVLRLPHADAVAVGVLPDGAHLVMNEADTTILLPFRPEALTSAVLVEEASRITGLTLDGVDLVPVEGGGTTQR